MKSFGSFAASVGLALEPFQGRIGRAIVGPEREVVISTPRGGGKTTIAALHAVHHLITTEGAAVYCVAASVPQARILYESAASFARELAHPNIVYRHHELRGAPTRRRRPPSPATCASWGRKRRGSTASRPG